MPSTLHAVALLTMSIAFNSLANDAPAQPETAIADPAEMALTGALAKSCLKLQKLAFDRCVSDVTKGLGAIEANYVEWELRKAKQDIEDAPRLKADQAKVAALLNTCRRKGWASGHAYIGMTRDQLITCGLGRPGKINTTELRGAYQEQYVYEGYGYVYLHNGVVDAIQTRQ